MTAQVTAATSKRDLIAEVNRLTDLVDWYHKIGEKHLRWAEEDDEKIELLEAENRLLWQRIAELQAP